MLDMSDWLIFFYWLSSLFQMSIFLFFTRKLANVDKFCVDVLQGYVFMATVGLNAWNKLLYN